MLDLVRLLRPDVLAITKVGSGEEGGRFIVKLDRKDRPVPLASLGEGVGRVYFLGLAVVNCAGGALLIDEFENGLHYEVQPKVWNAVFHLARDLQVQVFATTHSWDCIRAFADAMRAHPGLGQLTRLERSRDDPEMVQARVYRERDTIIAAERGIEVR